MDSAISAAERPRLVAVVHDDCTGCNTCVDYCLVDCIEPAPATAPLAHTVSIREAECIGCSLCAKVCDELNLHAIHLIPAAGPA